jgi:hypothetical protein
MACVERSAWTDERLDDLAARGESQFDLLLAEIRALREEMHEEFREMRGETARIRRDMFHGAIALFAALVAMYATMVVHALS